MDLIVVIILIFFTVLFMAIFGVVMGKWLAKIKKMLFEKQIEKNALKVIKGEMKNQTTDLNGKLIDVNKFVLFDKDNQKIMISLTDIPKEEKAPVIQDKETPKNNAKKKKPSRDLLGE